MTRFEHPYFLYLLALLPLMLLLQWGYRLWQKRAVQKIGDPLLVQSMIAAAKGRAMPGAFYFLMLVVVCLVVAAANPQLGSRTEQLRQERSDVFILFDVSKSMNCEDVAPNRLERARLFTRKLVMQLKGQQIGLIFFSGEAFLQMPLSSDAGAALMFLNEADPEMMSEQGTAIPRAIQLAGENFDPDPGAGRAIVLITDGENHEADALAAAEKAYNDGTVIFTVGVGTEEGGPIPYGGNAYKRDSENNIIRTRLDAHGLEDIAKAAHGNSYNVLQGDAAIESLSESLGTLEKRVVSVRSYKDFDSFFQYWLFPALCLLLLLEFKPLDRFFQKRNIKS